MNLRDIPNQRINSFFSLILRRIAIVILQVNCRFRLTIAIEVFGTAVEVYVTKELIQTGSIQIQSKHLQHLQQLLCPVKIDSEQQLQQILQEVALQLLHLQLLLLLHGGRVYPNSNCSK